MPELTEEQKKALEAQKAQCPFCKIVKGETESKKVYEDDLVLAILDINPAAKGHILIMPKEHYPIMPLIPHETFVHLFNKVREINNSATKAMLSIGSTVFIANGAAAGQKSQHFMLHIIPRDEKDGLDKFELKETEVDKDKIKEIHSTLSNNLGVMMRNHFARNPQPWHKATPGETGPQKFTEEQVLKIIEQNPQLKQAIQSDPEGAMKAIPQNPQLSQLFKDVDIKKIFAKLGAEVKEKGEKGGDIDEVLDALGEEESEEKTEEEPEEAEEEKPAEEETDEEDKDDEEDEDEDEDKDDEEDEEDEDEDTEEKKSELDHVSDLLGGG